jgi:ElaB/YqjD/DUF883 family membrane-anchored ribosome-binding protein
MIDPNHTMNLHAQTDERIASLNARIAELERELARAREMIRDADQYLSSNELNSIGAGSQLHRQFKAALAPTAEKGEAE